jgi:hypothetical protein
MLAPGTEAKLDRLLAILGGLCDPHLPSPQDESVSGGARNIFRHTPFDGTVALTTVTVVEIGVRGTHVVIAGIFDSGGSHLSGDSSVGVSTEDPRVTTNPPFVELGARGWLKRRRGFDRVFVVARGSVTIYPVITIVDDPGFDLDPHTDRPPLGANPVTISNHVSAADNIVVGDGTKAVTGLAITITRNGTWTFDFDSVVYGAAGDGSLIVSFHVWKNGIAPGIPCVRTVIAPDNNPVFPRVTVHLTHTLTGLVVGDVITIAWKDESVTDLAPWDTGGLQMDDRDFRGIGPLA